MRATIYGDRLIQAGTAINTILMQVVFKNLQPDDLKSIGTLNNPKDNEYIHAYNDFVANC